MIKIVFLISVIGSLLMFSCDDKIDSLDNLNTSPTIEIFRRSSINWEIPSSQRLLDTAKIWTPENNINYSAILRLTDPNSNFGSAEIILNNPEDDFFVDNVLYVGDRINIPLDSFNISYKGTSELSKEFRINAFDDFNSMATLAFEVYFQNNQTPIARLNIVPINGVANEYTLNASESFDQDRRYGGFIRLFQFIIDGEIIETTESFINHVFNQGEHIIELRVKDNDEVWSNAVTRTITIN